MSLKIVRQDITRMKVDAIVNTANEYPEVGTGCDYAIYQAAGYGDLLRYRVEHIGAVPEGDVFITPGFNLQCQYIIHAVSPLFIDGESGEEEKLRSCYKNSFHLAHQYGLHSIAVPLIATGGFGYPKEEGFRIAIDEIHAFLMQYDLEIYLVLFDQKATHLAQMITENLQIYIDQNYVEQKHVEEYTMFQPFMVPHPASVPNVARESYAKNSYRREKHAPEECSYDAEPLYNVKPSMAPSFSYDEMVDTIEPDLEERLKHISDTFSEYLVYLIESKGMSYPDVYKRALIDKKAFSKIKNNPDAHPKKITAMCLCIGAKLNLDQTKDLLARAGYALSPCDITDIIFSYFIENEIYDMIELDIQLEEHGQPCLIA